MGDPPGLLGQGLDELLHRVARDGGDDPTEEVQVLPTGSVPDADALTPDQLDGLAVVQRHPVG